MMQESPGPPELAAASERVTRYMLKTRGETQFRIFGKLVIPYPRNMDEYWWAVLLATKPFRTVFATAGGPQPLIDGPELNKSQTPREQCVLLKTQLPRKDWDLDWMFDEGAPEKELSVVQIDSTSNFLDRSAYTQKQILMWKFAEFVLDNVLVPHRSEVPQFLDYRLNVFANTATKCVKLQHKVELRNTPANLLTIDKKSLDAPVDIHGKVFLLAEGRDLTPEEVFEIVIFCMGQAEATELKLTSWDKLKTALQEEARKFLMSAQHVRPLPRVLGSAQ
jgi:hypothetical protein